MRLEGSFTVAAPQARVWARITDAALMAGCIPGCERMEKTDPTHFQAAATLKIGPVKATFKGNVALENLDPPHSATLKGEGQGGVAGFAKGEAQIVLTPEEGGTVLAYTAKANIGGKLAQIGQRLIDGAAKQIADNFFQRFAAAITPPPALEGDPTTAELEGELAIAPGMAPVEAARPSTPAPVIADTRRTGLTPVVWVGGLIVLIAALLLVFDWPF